MKKIAIEMSPIVHGTRAVKRCITCMVNELINYKNMNFLLVYFDYKHQKEKYLKQIETHVKERVIHIPQRLMIPLWKRYSLPNFETLLSENDLFYVNEFYFPPSKKATILATIHGLFYEVIPEKISPKKVKFYREGLSFILKHADYLVAVSESTKKDLIQYGGVNPERIYVVTHGVDNKFQHCLDQEKVRRRIKKNYGLQDPYILFVGAIAIHKNVMGILSAYNLLSNEIPHHLVMAGPPDSAWDSANLFAYKNDLIDRIHFLGHVFDTDKLVDLYNAADIFVFPSFYEGWTSPPLESMACGTPVITSNCSSLPETVGEAAILVDPYDTKYLANEMAILLTDKKLQQEMIEKGYEHVEKHTWKNSAAKLAKIFADVLSKGRCMDRNL